MCGKCSAICKLLKRGKMLFVLRGFRAAGNSNGNWQLAKALSYLYFQNLFYSSFSFFNFKNFPICEAGNAPPPTSFKAGNTLRVGC